MDNESLAKTLAYRFHAGQEYGPFPYTYHLTCVVHTVNDWYGSGDERLSIIAWLHDILEDTDCKEDTLRALFDGDVVDAVVALNKQPALGESQPMYLMRVYNNPLARKVKMADAYMNMTESLKRNDMKRVRKYADILGKLAA